ncbi:TPA: hypothetical protein H1009_00980 [archaeon]|nr:hypothetical protein [Candidatus Naiadarchaeales archaeon SRR2090153.bin461]
MFNAVSLTLVRGIELKKFNILLFAQLILIKMDSRIIAVALLVGLVAFAGCAQKVAETDTKGQNPAENLSSGNQSPEQELSDKTSAQPPDVSFSKCVVTKGVYDMLPAHILGLENGKGTSGPLTKDDRPLREILSDGSEVIISVEGFSTHYAFNNERLLYASLYFFSSLGEYNKYAAMVADMNEHHTLDEAWGEAYALKGAIVYPWTRDVNGVAIEKAFVLFGGANKALLFTAPPSINMSEVISAYAETVCPNAL